MGITNEENDLAQNFIQSYEEFYNTLIGLDEDYFNDFINRANNLLEDRAVGEALCHRNSDQIAELIGELDASDLKVLINFLLVEGILIGNVEEN